MKNKGERNRKQKNVFKKRLKNRGINTIDGAIWLSGHEYFKTNFQHNSLRTTGTPCSCPLCSPGKVEDKAKYRLNKFKKSDIYE